MGGATGPPETGGEGTTGLSPRGRGNPPGGDQGQRVPGSIPAWAGQPRKEWRRLGRYPVYPRVGGATGRDRDHVDLRSGLSPRGRGNRHHKAAPHTRVRSIPAWAGQPMRRTVGDTVHRVYPRVGGATVSNCPLYQRCQGLSPRGRGNRVFPLQEEHKQGSIPAWAGQP